MLEIGFRSLSLAFLYQFLQTFLFDEGQQIIIEFVYTDMLRNVNKIFFAIIF